MSSFRPTRVLSVFSLVMINVIAVDSIRTLPMAASYGLWLIPLYLLAALAFFIPTALITAELATTWPAKGGIYAWVKLAFGPQWGVCVVYLQWIYNVVWYPTILTLIAGTLAYLFDPMLVQNPGFMAFVVLCTFWGCTLLNCFGMRLSSAVSTFGSIVGTLAPMLLIIGLAFMWVNNGNPSAITIENTPPIGWMSLAFFTQIVYSLLGLEMSSVHAQEVNNPKKDYPRALLFSVFIIMFSLVFASLAVAVVVPDEKLDTLTGIIQAFNAFSEAFQLWWLSPLMAVAIVVGGICAVATWIIGPTKGLFAAADDGLLPPVLAKTNRFGVPIVMLGVQGVLCSLLTLLYLFLPSVEEAYVILSIMAAQLSMVMYAILFAAAIQLRYTQPNAARPFRIPGRSWGMWLTAGMGVLLCLSVIAIGFIPPTLNIDIGNIVIYEGCLVSGMAIILLPILFIVKPRRKTIKRGIV